MPGLLSANLVSVAADNIPLAWGCVQQAIATIRLWQWCMRMEEGSWRIICGMVRVDKLWRTWEAFDRKGGQHPRMVLAGWRRGRRGGLIFCSLTTVDVSQVLSMISSYVWSCCSLRWCWLRRLCSVLTRMSSLMGLRLRDWTRECQEEVMPQFEARGWCVWLTNQTRICCMKFCHPSKHPLTNYWNEMTMTLWKWTYDDQSGCNQHLHASP